MDRKYVKPINTHCCRERGNSRVSLLPGDPNPLTVRLGLGGGSGKAGIGLVLNKTLICEIIFMPLAFLCLT